MHAVAFVRRDLGGLLPPLRQNLENQRDREAEIGVAARSEMEEAVGESVKRQMQIERIARKRRQRSGEERRTRKMEREGGNAVSCEVDTEQSATGRQFSLK